MVTRRFAQMTCVVLAALALGACSKKTEAAHTEPAPQETPPVETAAAPAAAAPESGAAEARKMFKSRCAVCHGESGKGDGPGAAALNPKPRDYTDAEWQKSVTDEQLKSVILMGGAAVGKSPIMPASPDLQGKDAVVDGLVKIVRSFAKKE